MTSWPLWTQGAYHYGRSAVGASRHANGALGGKFADPHHPAHVFPQAPAQVPRPDKTWRQVDPRCAVAALDAACSQVGCTDSFRRAPSTGAHNVGAVDG